MIKDDEGVNGDGDVATSCNVIEDVKECNLIDESEVGYDGTDISDSLIKWQEVLAAYIDDLCFFTRDAIIKLSTTCRGPIS